jgi:hypothetical protein
MSDITTPRSRQDIATPRCRQRVDSQSGSLREQSPRSLIGTSLCKNVGVLEERFELRDSEAAHAEAKRALLWQLELERLRNATLKLEVQREICEGSDLRKRLWHAGPNPLVPATVFIPAVPAISTYNWTGVTVASSMPPAARVPVAQAPSSMPKVCWQATRCP